MKQNKLFKLWLLAVVMLAGSMGVKAQTTTGILTITRANFATGALVYGTDDLWTVTTTTSEVVTGYFDIYSTAGQTTMQTRTNTPIGSYPYNIDALPGPIIKVTLTGGGTGTARAWTPYLATTALTKANYTSGTSQGTKTATDNAASTEWIVDPALNFKYFYLNMTGGAAYLNSIEIEYQVGESSPTCTPSSLAFANSTVTKSVTDGLFTNAATSLNATADITYSSSDAAVATVDATTGEVTIVAAGTATITASQDAGTHNAVDYCAATATYELTVNALAAPVAANSPTTTNTSFLAEWSAVSGADSYELNVYTKEPGANATDLFISEYGEGAPANRKYIEIYNGTGSAVDLSNYSLKRASNGGGWPESGSAIVTFSELVLSNNSTYVIANNEPDVSGADLYNSGFAGWNGDDAVGLFKNDILIDVIGTPNEDPGTGWAVAGTDNATVDNILVRKSSILAGNTDWTVSAGTSTENSEWIISRAWNAGNSSTPETLGAHTFAGGETLTPVTGSPFTVNAPAVSRSITGLSNAEIYFFTVKAVSGAFESPLSNEIGPISLTATGLSNAKVDALAWTSSGKVMLNASAGEVIEIFNVAGQKVVSRPAVDGLNSVDVSAKGVVIVKVNNRISKVIL